MVESDEEDDSYDINKVFWRTQIFFYF